MNKRASTKLVFIATAAAFLFSMGAFDFIYASVSHTVKKGENIARIAKKHKVSSAKIREANDLSSDKLSIGQKLIIPSDKKTAKEKKQISKSSEQKKSSRHGSDDQSYTVKKGDNIYNIAKKFKTTPAKIKDANDLASSRLAVGRKLIIPSDTKIKTAQTKESKRSAKVAAQEKSDSSGPVEQTYTVQKRDTILRIAKKFKTTAAKIRDANDLDSVKLKIGSKLVIPSEKTVRIETPDKKNAVKQLEETTPEHKVPDEQHYSVHKGDSIDKIARKFNTTADDIKEDNHLDSDKLSVGRKLVIHPDTKDDATHTSENKAIVKAPEHKISSYRNTAELETRPLYKYHRLRQGETLAYVAKKYGISVKELKTINDIKKRKKVRPGQNLIVGNISERGSGYKSRKIQRVDITKKIEQVKTLSESPELADMSATDRLLLFAKKMIDLPYKFGANGGIGVDCSSFVQRVYSLVDMKLPRSAREQFHVGEKVSKDELKSGDLLFFRTYARFPSHVGIYLGDNLFIHASSVSKRVQIDSLDKPYYIQRYIGAKRLLTDSAAKVDDTAAAIVSDVMNKEHVFPSFSSAP
jgi:peptidoglycan DL-endopeptidase LytE